MESKNDDGDVILRAKMTVAVSFYILLYVWFFLEGDMFRLRR